MEMGNLSLMRYVPLSQQELHWIFLTDFLFQDKTGENEASKHQSSSIEDLIILFNKEKELIRTLNSTKHQSKTGPQVMKLIDSYTKTVDYDL